MSGAAAGTAESAARIIPHWRVAAAAQAVIPEPAEAVALARLVVTERVAVQVAAVQVAALTPRALVAVLEFTEREQTELAVLTQAVTATPEPAVLAVKPAQQPPEAHLVPQPEERLAVAAEAQNLATKMVRGPVAQFGLSGARVALSPQLIRGMSDETLYSHA